MEIESKCVVCDKIIKKPLVGQLTCGKVACKKKYTKIRTEAKKIGLELPRDL